MDRGAWRAAAHGVAKNRDIPERARTNTRFLACVSVPVVTARLSVHGVRGQIGKIPSVGPSCDNVVCGQACWGSTAKAGGRKRGRLRWSCITPEALASFAQTAGAGRPQALLLPLRRSPRGACGQCARRPGSRSTDWGAVGAAAADACAPWSWGRGPAQGALVRASCSLLCPHGGGPLGRGGRGAQNDFPVFFQGSPPSLMRPPWDSVI